MDAERSKHTSYMRHFWIMSLLFLALPPSIMSNLPSDFINDLGHDGGRIFTYGPAYLFIIISIFMLWNIKKRWEIALIVIFSILYVFTTISEYPNWFGLPLWVILMIAFWKADNDSARPA